MQSATTSSLLTGEDIHHDVSFLLHLDSIVRGETRVLFHYQPIVDLSRGVVTGYEALVRFPPEMGASPNVSFEIAGHLGRRLELEEVVSRAAIHSRELLPPNCFLSVNISPPFLLSDRWQTVLSTLSDLSHIVVEITEGEAIQDYEHTRRCLAQIRSLGGNIAVDDAGAGYASLKHVIEMKPAFIKLDRMFITNCQSEPAKATLIEMIGRAANRLDAWIIAEGVETLGELDELIDIGIPLGQGYYLGRPNSSMSPIMPERAAEIRSRNQVHQTGVGLQKHLQVCPAEPNPATAQTLLLCDSSVEVVAVIDNWRRPIELVERHPISGIRRIFDILKIQLFTDPAEVLHRALTRPTITRFDPVAVIDNQGEFLGIVSIDRLMRALLD